MEGWAGAQHSLDQGSPLPACVLLRGGRGSGMGQGICPEGSTPGPAYQTTRPLLPPLAPGRGLCVGRRGKEGAGPAHQWGRRTRQSQFRARKGHRAHGGHTSKAVFSWEVAGWASEGGPGGRWQSCERSAQEPEGVCKAPAPPTPPPPQREGVAPPSLCSPSSSQPPLLPVPEVCLQCWPRVSPLSRTRPAAQPPLGVLAGEKEPHGPPGTAEKVGASPRQGSFDQVYQR